MGIDQELVVKVYSRQSFRSVTDILVSNYNNNRLILVKSCMFYEL